MYSSDPLCNENIERVAGLINIMCLVCIAVSNSLVLDQGLSATLMSRQCLQALLLISGVEQNPGPITQQSIIEELSSKTSNDVIKKVLAAYPVGKTLLQKKTAITKFSREELTNQDKYQKKQVIHNLFIRIQNLLPDTCSLCKKEYHTSLDDTPLLSCEVCGQGSQNSYIISVIGIEESEESSIDPQTARKKIIPLELPGVHYMCMTCSNDYIPDDNEGILKTLAQDNTEKEGSTPEGFQIPEVQPVDPETTNPSGSVDNPSQSAEVNIESLPLPQPLPQPVSQPLPQPLSQAQTPSQGTNGRSICHHYRKNQCKHGFRGRGCNNLHPQPCKKLMRHGTKAPNGCNMGRSKCEKFHPNLCPYSMTKYAPTPHLSSGM